MEAGNAVKDHIKEDESENEDNYSEEYKEYTKLSDGKKAKRQVVPNLKDKINIHFGNQGQFGLCWDFATVKSIENYAALKMGKDYDISESHIDYMTSNLMKNSYRNANFPGIYSSENDYEEKIKEL